MKRHIFVICAYKESEYLEECIVSLKAQTIPSKIIIATSTPNSHIDRLAQQYGIPVCVNMGEHGITQDWNFAYNLADAKFVTIAHQDDVYEPQYTEQMISYMKRAKEPIIYFTDYGEIRNGKRVTSNKLLLIKRLMLFLLRYRIFWHSRFVRRRILSLGSPICCPSVTFVKSNCGVSVFRHGFRADEDWEAWELLSRHRGSFVYNKNIMMYHRIHQDSETSNILGENARSKEDFIMYRKFWPVCIAKLLTKLYSSSEESNNLKQS